MPNFKYKALNDVNELVAGEIEAVDLRDAREKIRNLGYIPTKVYTQEISDIQEKPVIKESPVTNLSLSNKILFTSGLEDLLSSGIPIMEALNILEKNNRDFKIRTICRELQKAIYTGMTFSDALNCLFKNVFGSVYIGLVKAGETSGKLEATLERIVILLNKQVYIREKILRASAYPGFLCALLAGLPAWGAIVYPSFSAYMAHFGADMPPISQTFFGTLEFLYKFWWLVLMIICAFIGGCIILYKNPVFKAKWDAFLLKLPIVSNFVKYLNLANYMTVLFISYEAGVPLPSGMDLANKTIGNLEIKSILKQAASDARQGHSLEEAYRKTDIIPPQLFSMISTGEKAGTLSKSFRDIAIVIDKKLDISLSTLMNVFKYTLMILLAIVVGYALAAFQFAYFGLLTAPL